MGIEKPSQVDELDSACTAALFVYVLPFDSFVTDKLHEPSVVTLLINVRTETLLLDVLTEVMLSTLPDAGWSVFVDVL